MRAVLLRARAELRGRRRSWLGLAVLIGLVSGVVMAAAAGAGRTESAYQRFLDRQRAADVFLDNYPDPGVATVDPEAVERLPQVAESARAAFLFVEESGAVAPVDERFGRAFNRLQPVEGRLPLPHQVGEIAVGFERARESGWDVGTTLPLIPPEFEADAREAGVENVRLRVVGLVAAPGDFPPLEQGGLAVYLTPAFHAAYEDTPLLEDQGEAIFVRLRRGADDMPAFRTAVQRLAGGRPVSMSVQADDAAAVQRTLDTQGGALRAFGVLLGLTACVVLGQALRRQAFLEADAHGTLRAVGFTHRQLWAVGMVRALAIAAAAVPVALAVALALSPLTPLGEIARTAEPEPGVRADLVELGAGAAALAGVVLLLAAPAAWAAARGPAGTAPASRTPSRLEAITPALAGVRMALNPGRGRGSVPVRTSLLALGAGVAAVAAALTFAASSDRLLDTPRLYGWNWDLAVTNYGEGEDLSGPAGGVLARDPAVEEAAAVDVADIDIGGRRIAAIAMQPLKGTVLPPVTEGRGASAPGELMLGARTMRALDVDLGDTVTASAGRQTVRMRVVGRAVLPALFSPGARLGEGAVLLQADARRLDPEERAGGAVMRLRPGTDAGALLARHGGELGQLFRLPVQRPADVVDFGRIRGLPLILATVLAALAAATLAHVLVTAVRRRRRDFAVLKAAGYVRGQVRTVVLAQALTYAFVAVAAGLPLGALAGRLAWNVFAERQGAVPEVVVPLPVLLLAALVAALVAVVLALGPARSATRTPPAAALRTE